MINSNQGFGSPFELRGLFVFFSLEGSDVGRIKTRNNTNVPIPIPNISKYVVIDFPLRQEELIKAHLNLNGYDAF